MGFIETIKMLVLEEAYEKGIEIGIEMGIEQAKTDAVKHMIASKRMTVAEMASYAEVSEDFVCKIMKDLNGY